MTRFRDTCIAFLAVSTCALSAEACEQDYQTLPNDTIFSIAENAMGDATRWPLILDANPVLKGANLALLEPGIVLNIPCEDSASVAVVPPSFIPPAVAEPATETSAMVEPAIQESAAVEASSEQSVIEPPAPEPPAPVVEQNTTVQPATDPSPVSQPVIVDAPKLKLLTSAHYAPFARSGAAESGLMTDLVNAALKSSAVPDAFTVTWDADWATHLNLLNDHSAFDMGFPWPRPDCEGNPDDRMCQDFLFSDALIEMPVGLFVKRNDSFKFETDSDILGKSICLPDGYTVQELDTPDRRWVSDDKIKLVAGDDIEDCFNKVLFGDVDATVVNLVMGATRILDLGLRFQIVPLGRPIAMQSLRAVISKQHPKNQEYLSEFNTGLRLLKESGAYEGIVARHGDALKRRLETRD